MTKNIVLGLAHRYGVLELKNFVLSFRKYHKTESIFLYVSEYKVSELKEFCESYEVGIIPTAGNYKYSTPHNNKWHAFKDFLDSATQYTNICLVDTRDIIFQGNIFNNVPKESFLYCWTEDNAVSIKNNHWNNKWLFERYNNNYEELKDNIVVCSGVMIGTYDLVHNALKICISELEKMYERFPKDINSKFVLDQAVFLYVIYKFNDLLNAKIHNNGNLVAHIGESILNSYSRDQVEFENGKIFVNGEIPYIIHQYDRSEFLKNYFDMHYQYINISALKDDNFQRDYA